jgi:hypothetical protein
VQKSTEAESKASHDAIENLMCERVCSGRCRTYGEFMRFLLSLRFLRSCKETKSELAVRTASWKVARCMCFLSIEQQGLIGARVWDRTSESESTKLEKQSQSSS